MDEVIRANAQLKLSPLQLANGKIIESSLKSFQPSMSFTLAHEFVIVFIPPLGPLGSWWQGCSQLFLSNA